MSGVRTIGEAWRLGWRVTARCIWSAPGRRDRDGREGRAQIQCDTTTELDMKTLVWTRGDRFPLDQLGNRLMCPNCGSREIKIIFTVPGAPRANAIRA